MPSFTWFITGASSGVGLALAQAAAGRGHTVVALARHVASPAALAGGRGAAARTSPAGPAPMTMTSKSGIATALSWRLA
jgi:NAD(P)-dependent dehydrogenase (short-subunit alcohol dehydrogenase family)